MFWSWVGHGRSGISLQMLLLHGPNRRSPSDAFRLPSGLVLGRAAPLYCSPENWLVDSWAREEMHVAWQGGRSRFRQVFRFGFQILAIVVQA